MEKIPKKNKTTQKVQGKLLIYVFGFAYVSIPFGLIWFSLADIINFPRGQWHDATAAALRLSIK